LPETTTLGISFRDKYLRDVFNKNLAKLKQSGEYQHIIRGYTSGEIAKKIEFSSLVAALSSRFIFLEDKEQLGSILDLLTTLPYIKKIEAFNNNASLLYSSSTQQTTFYKQMDSVNLLSGVEAKVGYVKVYFDDEQVATQLNKTSLIPDIVFYKGLTQYRFVWEVYRRFNFLEKQIDFTAQEQNFLLSPPVLTFSEVDWQPLSMVKDGKFSGIIADYLDVITKKTGIEFEFKPQDSWRNVLNAFNNNQIEIIPSVGADFNVNERSEVTNVYAKFRLAIVMNNEASYVDGVTGIKDRTVALPKGYISYKYIKTNYPDTKIVETDNIAQALTLVRNGKADAFVGHLAIVAYQLENFFTDLKIVGQLDHELSHRILLKRSEPLLLSIFNKAIASIPPQQHRLIRNRWLSQQVTAVTDYKLIYQMASVFFVILALMLLFFNKLSKAKKLIERTNIELQQSIRDLKQAQDQLVETEKMASLGGLVAGIAHEINTPVGIGLTAITHFTEISKRLADKYQQNKMSKQDFDGFLVATTESAKIINRNLERTADLVRSFKQISVDQSSDERRTFNVKEYIYEILLSIHHITKKSNVAITLQCDPSLIINSYPGALSQIVSNLVINSTIHGFPNNEFGDASITIDKKSDTVMVVYQDNGRGIAKKHLSKIYEPFFTTNREHGGSGLGLNIIYNIVTNRLGGTITCNSEEGEGVEFIIRFEVE
jgi:signal transduction histidine kinase